MKRVLLTLLGIAALGISAIACADPSVLRLATTTSTENSGLLGDILPRFEKDTGMHVKVIAVGTGKALRLGQNGDVDVVLVHAPPAELKFVAAGYGVNRRKVMYNDFILVGPASDPAKISGLKNVEDAFRRIADSHSLFVSRGDDSGTNKKELAIWKAAKITPHGKWYRAAGQGMGKVLQVAAELDGYTLTDRGTWLAYESKLPLKLLMQGDPRMYNPYGVIAVNPSRYPDVNYTGAMRFIAWLTSVEGQNMISAYRKHNQQLFVPMAITNAKSTHAAR